MSMPCDFILRGCGSKAGRTCGVLYLSIYDSIACHRNVSLTLLLECYSSCYGTANRHAARAATEDGWTEAYSIVHFMWDSD